jgi:hemerythrin superfamily protein
MTNQIDAIELLLCDHRLIDGLAEQLDTTDDPIEISRLYQQIVAELIAHEAAEQDVVFPAFQAVLGPSDDDTVAHRMGEHEELNDLLAEMRTLAPDCFAFMKRGSALMLEVKGHFQREEESVFSRIRASFTPDELVEMGTQVLAAKQHCVAADQDHRS